MNTKRPRRMFTHEILEIRRVLDSTVVFNEIMYNPIGQSEQLEFVELHNQMAVDMDISKWRLAEGAEFEFPEGTIVPGGGYLVVSQDPEALKAATNVDSMGPYVGRLSNNGERLALLDRNDRQMDEIEFNDKGKWTASPDGSGTSLSKVNENSLSSRPDNWSSSFRVGGTPGKTNFDNNRPPEPDTVINLLSFEDTWRYDDSGNNLGNAWRDVDFNDAAWSAGAGPLYVGNTRLAGVGQEPISNVSATASTELAGHLATHVVDGSGLDNGTHVTNPSFGTMWQSNGTFFGLEPDLDPEITFDLGHVQMVESMSVWNFNNVDSPTCCLDKGVRKADILVAGEDGIFTTAIEDQEFTIAPGTTTNFSQSIDLGGINARYVKIDIDTENGVANHGALFDFVGLSEVQFSAFPPAGNTEINAGANTHYFRKQFEFNQAPNRTDLSMELLVDDGAVVYLNGAEIYRHNMPVGEIDANTNSLFEIGSAASSGIIELPGQHLQIGSNVLAVEVHQAVANDADMVFAMDLTSITSPPEPFSPDAIDVTINEIAGSQADTFFVELRNTSNQAVNISGFEIGGGAFAFTIPNDTMLKAGEYYVANANDNRPSSGELISLANPNDSLILSSIRIGEDAIAFSEPHNAFLRPVVATPGADNTFDFTDDIVINEIMYNHRPAVADPGVPPTFALTNLLPFDAAWRYNDKGDDLDPDWYLTPHPEGDNWQIGQGLIGFETGRLPAPGIQTITDDPRVKDILTFYFETEIELTADQLNSFDAFQMKHIIDDGAVFYVNGNEITRFNIDPGDVDSETRSNASVRNAEVSEPFTISRDMFVEGTNHIAVEVHQRSPGSGDIVFGFNLQAGTISSPGLPPTEYSDNPEEWIEIYNKGDQTIDLSGWSFADAIRYDFPAGQQIQPGQYLVIPRDDAALRAKYPELGDQILNDYSGSLNNQTERIVLRDANGNPADIVEYYQDGEWPRAADGGGSTLELRDPHADNSQGLAWAASDESARAPWRSYSYEGIAKASSLGPDGVWEEFVIGLLADGEILLDDISIIHDPNGAATEVLQNGSFESDEVGQHPDKWRLIGNHRHSEVIVDPDDPNNKVLRFVGTSATEHMHNHGETTLMDGDGIHDIRNGNEYKISFKGKWITGSNQLNTRLYFNRLPRTTPIQRHDRHGTPGAANSVMVDNLGPTYDRFIHSPAVPDNGQDVTVSVAASDADGIGSMDLWYRVERGAWESTPMTIRKGIYAGSIPGQDEGTIVQFYVEGKDQQNNVTTFPRAGRDSRALFQVNDGNAADTGLHNLRLILSPEDATFLHSNVELMSNDPNGATFIYDESEIFYDSNIRLSGSQRARPFDVRLSFRIGFNSDHLFRGVHSGITLDRSESTGFGQREHLYHHGMNHAGGLPTEYNDLFNIITPKRVHTGTAEAQLARYSDLFFDEQYPNGSAGDVYEYELTYYPTQTTDRDPESRKRPQPDSVAGIPIRYLGDNKEDYRWGFLNKNNRAEDDYSEFMEFTKVFQTSGNTFNENIDRVIDVDQWLRGFAFSVITGHGDNYGADGSQHNFQMYVRPSDNRVLFLPHDLDAFFNRNRALVGNNDLRKLMRVPEREHMYYGHVHDMIQTTFNQDYMERWGEHWRELIPRQRFDRHVTEVEARSNFLITQIERAAARVDFSVTTENVTVDEPFATISGNGWINVREIRPAGSQFPLNVTWTTETAWQADVPLVKGLNVIEVEAYDFQGELIDSKSIDITSTVDNPVGEALVISEINYNPQDPNSQELERMPLVESDDFEFLEVTNRSDVSVNALGVSFTSGISFTFPSMILAPGESTVVVADESAFENRYGNDIRIAGEFDSGRLSNSGERLTLQDSTGNSIVDFVYGENDPWPIRADGAGSTLALANPLSADADSFSKYYAWFGSPEIGGTPGSLGSAQNRTIVINEILANSDPPAVDSVELLNAFSIPIDVSGWYLSDDGDDLRRFQIPEGTVIDPNSTVVFTETDFNPTPNDPLPNHFALSGRGDQVWLTSTDSDGIIDRFIDEVDFIDTHTSQTIGRFPNGTGRFAPMESNTIGADNSAPKPNSIVISEIHYSPAEPTEAALAIDPTMTSDLLEFVELTNASSVDQNLTNWRLRTAIDMDFDSQILRPGESIVVVSFAPENISLANAFREQYGINDSVRLVGAYANQLDNDWEKLTLRMAGASVADANLFALSEEVIYDDVQPWPSGADGTGPSLVRKSLNDFANDAANWIAASASPGTTDSPAADINGDGVADVQDVDLLCSSLHTGGDPFDLNQDGQFDFGDMEHMIQTLLHTNFGDANVDGTFNSRDLVQVFVAGEYEDDIENNSTWSEGDWTCDGDFATTDLVLAFQSGGYVQEAVSVIPDLEMTTVTMEPDPSHPKQQSGITEIDHPENSKIELLNIPAMDLVFEELENRRENPNHDEWMPFDFE